MGAFIDITGLKSGRLTVISKLKKRSPRKEIMWKCSCECGRTHLVRGADLKNATIKSCGCLQREHIVSLNKNRNPDAITRFHSYYIKVESGCWEWQNYLDEDGYGQFVEKDRSPVKAHRFSYEFYIGKIPDGLFVCHDCDNPKCVNPAHLFVGTHQDNMDDMKNKNRQSRRGNPKNENGEYFKGV